MRPVIQIAATLDRANRKKDRSLTLSFTTNSEIDTKEFSLIDTYAGNSGWLLFSENQLSDEDVPDEDAPTDGGKSKASRLRAVAFLLWRKTDMSTPFDVWWTARFEKILDQLKDKLDD